jgi:exosome complex component RRP40
VYAQVCLADKDMEPELTCVSAKTNKADGFGELKGGFVWPCSLPMARCLLRQGSPVMSELAKHFPFEAAIGLNGRVWINSGSTQHTILIGRTLAELTGKGMVNSSIAEIKRLIKSLLDSLDIDD